MNPETLKWIEQSPVAALLCRDLRHSWPRPQQPGPGRARYRNGIPPDTKMIGWKVLSQDPRVLERTMFCDAGCGVRRTEVFVVRGERLVRSGRPKMKYPAAYLRRRTEPDEPLEALDVDVLRGSIVARLYPGLKW